MEYMLIRLHIPDYVIQERNTCLAKMLTPLYEFVQGMLNGSWHIRCYNEEYRFCLNPDCFAMATGSLMQSLRANNLEFLLKDKVPSYDEMSVEDLYRRICGLKMTTLLMGGSSQMRGHLQRHYEEPLVNVYQEQQKLFGKPDPENYRSFSGHECFLYNQRMDMGDRGFSKCPLARELEWIQNQATAVSSKIKGFTV